jgi:hypothetical protein
MRWPDEPESVQEGPGTRIRSFGSFFIPKHEIWTGSVRNADPVLDARSVVRCRTGFAYSHGTGAKADVQIWTLRSRSASHLFNCVPYCLKKIPKVLKSPDSHEKW